MNGVLNKNLFTYNHSLRKTNEKKPQERNFPFSDDCVNGFSFSLQMPHLRFMKTDEN